MMYRAFLFLVSVLLVAGCNKPSAEQYMANAVAARDSSNFPLAIEQYQKLVDDHPSSPQAEEALFAIASMRNDNLHDFPGAIEAYKKFIETYPQAKQAPIAQFLIGYLYNNELHNLTAAKEAFQKFLTLYPNHEMAVSATFELQNLGKSPEELLPALQQSRPQVAAEPPKKGMKKN